MRFTDENLRNFRRALEKREPYPMNDDEFKALLGRLLAAEGCVKVMQECSECNSWSPSIDAIKTWKEASGKH